MTVGPDFLHFGCFELDVRGHTQAQGAIFSYALKLTRFGADEPPLRPYLYNISSSGTKLDGEVALRYLKSFDNDGDGVIQYDEFVSICTAGGTCAAPSAASPNGAIDHTQPASDEQ